MDQNIKDKFIKDCTSTINEYRQRLNKDYAENKLRNKFTKATDKQIEKKIDRYLTKINNFLDKITIIVNEELTYYDITTLKNAFDINLNQEIRFKNLETLISDRVGLI